MFTANACMMLIIFNQTIDLISGEDNMYSTNQICRMIEFLNDNIFIKFGNAFFVRSLEFQWLLPLPPPPPYPFADLFHYFYYSDFLDNMIGCGHRKLASSFTLCFRYVNDLIVFNNKKFWEYVKDIYPSQLNVEKTNQCDNLASYL